MRRITFTEKDSGGNLFEHIGFELNVEYLLTRNRGTKTAPGDCAEGFYLYKINAGQSDYLKFLPKSLIFGN